MGLNIKAASSHIHSFTQLTQMKVHNETLNVQPQGQKLQWLRLAVVHTHSRAESKPHLEDFGLNVILGQKRPQQKGLRGQLSSGKTMQK